ncbi:hypothetical protein [Streptomyces sp. NPDC059378]|uniref:hypothetical protein n=1 Tax=Streptomyces sp. NPDC059378 TaxID=3346815 RepID=UPI00369A2591
MQAALLAAWETTAALLPEAVTDPPRMRWAAPSTTKLRITAWGPYAPPLHSKT